jgi:hypothetical protein
VCGQSAYGCEDAPVVRRQVANMLDVQLHFCSVAELLLLGLVVLAGKRGARGIIFGCFEKSELGDRRRRLGAP